MSSGINAGQFKIQTYQLSIHIYSGNGAINPDPILRLLTPYVGQSREAFETSWVDSIYDTTGIFHNGFVNCLSPFTNPLGVYLGLTSTPLSTIDIWIQSYAWHGTPLVQVSQTAGSFTKSTTQLVFMPLTGWVKLDMIQSTPIFLYRNPNNIGNYFFFLSYNNI